MASEIWTKLQTECILDDETWKTCLLGVMEEIGEFYAAEAFELPITPEQRATAYTASIGCQGIYALNVCRLLNLDFRKDIVDIGYNEPQDIDERSLLGIISLAARMIRKADQLSDYDWTTNSVMKQRAVVFIAMWYRWAWFKTEKLNLGKLSDIIDWIHHRAMIPERKNASEKH